ncbi:hypothetical protein K439DRAFT_922854 [Ramaria rubella]|nr:hypothetical protein K439DRAFT_922854 [Ramaria rubella]
MPGDENVQTTSEASATQELVKSCLDVIDKHRSGTISGTQAVLRLTGLLPGPRQDTAFARYVEQIHETERIRAAAEERVKQIQSGSAATLDTRPGPSANAGEEAGDEGSVGSVGDGGSRKRRRRDSNDADGGGHPKKQSDETLYGWNHTFVVPPPINEPVDPVLERTLRLKQTYLVDSKGAKADLLGQRGCAEFPDSLWIDVLLDRYIELDKVYSGTYSLNPDYTHAEKIGDVEIIVNASGSGSMPSKTIRTHGEWSIACVSYKNAILFAYPHRERELDEYSRFIIGQFKALQDTSLHTRVIDLDRMIRLRVSRSNIHLLTSYDKFNDLVTQYILAPSAFSVSRISAGKRQ